MPVLAVDILARLVAHSSLGKTLQFTQVQRFLEFTRRMWPEIVGKTGGMPVVLPPHPAAFLLSVLSLPPDIIALSWLVFSDIAATFHQDPIPPSLDDGFRLHGDDHRIGAEPLNPPVHVCPRPGCNHMTLGEASVVEARLYTLNRGVLPVFSRSLYCRYLSLRVPPAPVSSPPMAVAVVQTDESKPVSRNRKACEEVDATDIIPTATKRSRKIPKRADE
ncbi:hypothetical protein B0H10DRAFT_1960552 [Mycena sp. CBHHK59/15]|nr:hypothetical protein B0H10DRAFT_1960552 [Mycena sp. CBHHK59/15]